MLRGLGLEVSAFGVGQYYADLVTTLVIDQLDADLQPRIAQLGIQVEVTNTIMRTLEDKRTLARTVLQVARMASRDLCRDSRQRF
jgi:LPPG:FO 2-phospho-L-lactate transferase